MADASFNQTSFLGGQWSPSAHGRIELPVYRTALATSLNGLPIEEGAWTGRSGTRDLGLTSSSASGQLKEFWLPNNQAAILELTPQVLRVWVMDGTAGYRALPATYSTDYKTVAICQTVQIIQADGVAFFLLAGTAPFMLSCTNFSIAGLGVDPLFTFAHVVFGNTDGPYLDPLPGSSQTNNSLGEVSDFHFATTFTITDGAYSFVADDFARGIRLWSQPPAWDSTASYGVGDAVSFAGTFWTALIGGSLQVGVQPGAVTQPPSGSSSVPTQAWSLSPQLGVWAYGKITEVISSDQVSVALVSPNAIPTNINGLVIDTWQLGLYTGDVFPSCGVFHAGRVMFSGAVPGRYDFSVANGTNPLMFSPTDEFGNVLDDSGISYTLTLTPVSSALWAISDHGGIVVGTAAGEVLITASTLNDPLTPTSVDARWASHYKGAAIEPVRMGIGIGFVQSFGRRLEEYVVDVFSQKFIGRHLNEFSKGLTTSGIKKIVYQEEIAPVIWCVTNNGTLLGCTYRRVSNFGTEGPLFSAWHTHTLGSGRSVEWACLGTTTRGTEDVLILLTFDGRDRRLEMMQPLFDDGQTLQQAWPLDSAFSSGTLSGTDNDGDTITISGLPMYIGVTNYSVWLAGLYCGSYPVIKPSGTIQVPYGSDPDGLLTAQWLLSHTGSTYGVAFSVAGSNVVVPCVVGFPFTQTIKLLRPATVEDVRTQTGPGLAKTRRSHMYGLLVANSVTGALISVDNGPTAPISFVEPDQQTKIDHATLYSGVHWDTLDDDYTFDGQIVIQQPLPYPLTIAAVTGFIHTQDR